jgi:hypothetical protein
MQAITLGIMHLKHILNDSPNFEYNLITIDKLNLVFDKPVKSY